VNTYTVTLDSVISHGMCVTFTNVKAQDHESAFVVCRDHMATPHMWMLGVCKEIYR
jgi:hypothetical protein